MLPATRLLVDPRAPQNAATNTFTTLEAARDALRNGLGKGTPRHVLLAATNHLLHRPFTLGAADSGTAEAPIIYKTGPAYLPRRARITGGVIVPQSAFKPAQVPSGFKGVWVANLKGIVNASSFGDLADPYPKAMMRMYYNGAPAVLARDPNVRGTTLHAPWMYAGYEAATVESAMALRLNDTATGQRWAAAAREQHADLWLHGFWKYDWRDTYVRVTSVDPVSRSAGGGRGGNAYRITRANDTKPQYPWIDGCRFYAVNALTLLDAAGEYFLDKAGMRLYYATGDVHTPPPGEVTLSVLPSVISLKGANHTSLANLTISDAQGDAVAAVAVSHLNITGCQIANAGETCVGLSGHDITLRGSVVAACGGAGVSISGGDEASLTRGNMSVVGNSIHGFALCRRTYDAGVNFHGVGAFVANNTIADAPHTAITGGGCLNLFEHNTIRHACFGSIDVGSFYIGRSWAQRGNVARFNTFDTIRPTERLAQQSASQSAFYLDDQMSGWDFYSNVVFNASTGVLLGGGRRNRIHANHFAACDTDVAFDNRGMTWESASTYRNCSVSMGTSTTSCFYNALRDVRYTAPPFATAFPEVVDVYNDHPGVPVHNVIEDNTYCHAGSAGGGRFVNQDAAQIRAWLSTASNNVEDCSRVVVGGL